MKTNSCLQLCFFFLCVAKADTLILCSMKHKLYERLDSFSRFLSQYLCVSSLVCWQTYIGLCVSVHQTERMKKSISSRNEYPFLLIKSKAAMKYEERNKWERRKNGERRKVSKSNFENRIKYCFICKTGRRRRKNIISYLQKANISHFFFVFFYLFFFFYIICVASSFSCVRPCNQWKKVFSRIAPWRIPNSLVSVIYLGGIN